MQSGLFHVFSSASRHHNWVVWASRFLVFAALCLTSCSSEELALGQAAGNAARAYTLTQLEENAIPFRFIDSQSGQVITEQLNVKFTGAARVRNVQGQVLNERDLTVSNGLLTVMPDFTAGNTFSLLVGNRQLGYVETGLIVGGGSKYGELSTFDVPLIKLTNTSITGINSQDMGISVAKSSVPAMPDGSLPAVTLATPSKNITGSFPVEQGQPLPTMATGEARIEIQAGTKALDSNGRTVVISGPVTVSAVHYSGQDEDALMRFPGGFVTQVSGVLPLGSASSGQGMFITGGFATFNVTDSQGRALKNFDRALQMRIDTPKVTMNPSTGKPYKAGDTFPVFAFDETTGRWSFETLGQVFEKSPPHASLLEVRYSAQHLTSWNLDHYPSTDCPLEVTLPFDREQVTLRAFGSAAWPFFIPDGVLRDQNQPSNPNSVRLKLPRLSSAAYNFFNVDTNEVSTPSAVNQLRLDVRHKVTGSLIATFYHDGSCNVTKDPDLPDLRAYDFNVTENCATSARLSEATDMHVTAYGRLKGSSTEQVLLEVKGTNWLKGGADSRSILLRSDLPQETLITRFLLREYLPGPTGLDGYKALREVSVPASQQSNSSFALSFSLVSSCPGGGGPPSPPMMSQ